MKLSNGDSTAFVNENSTNDLTNIMNEVAVSSCKLKRQGSTSPTGSCGNNCQYLENTFITNAKILFKVRDFFIIENQFTLEADYIRRYLGELTPLQESKLVQLKKSFVHSHKGKVLLIGIMFHK